MTCTSGQIKSTTYHGHNFVDSTLLWSSVGQISALIIWILLPTSPDSIVRPKRTSNPQSYPLADQTITLTLLDCYPFTSLGLLLGRDPHSGICGNLPWAPPIENPHCKNEFYLL